MKYALLALSALCLSFTFVKNMQLNDDNIPQETAPAPIGDNEGVTANKGASVSDVVTKAQTFYSLLSSTQQSALQLTYTTTLARKWSNLPCGANCRNGVQFGTFSTAQLAAAQDLIKAALSSNSNDGFAEWEAIRLGEAYLHANGGGNGYDSTLRWIAFLNTPTATGQWMLQFGGHHYAANIAFNNGHVVGATPYFMGLEPKTFTWQGTTYQPLNDERDALASIFASLSSTQLASAKLSQSFSDCYMIPGETNGGQSVFPAKAGISCSTLTQAQKNLVLAAIAHYTGDMDTATGNTCYEAYAASIDTTYISYVGTGTSGSASSFLVNQGDYVRIDGPRVWIEFSCQGGIVIQGQIHYHTVWRDHSHDYGLDLTGAPIDVRGNTSNGIASFYNTQPATIYPNPAAGRISVVLPTAMKDATMRIVNASGQTIWKSEHSVGMQGDIDMSRFASGIYYLYINDANGAAFSGKFVKK